MASALTSNSRRRPVLLVVLSIGAIAMLLPFYWMIISAFKPTREVMQFPPTLWPAEPTLDHWFTIFTGMRGGFHVFFMNSLFVTVTVTLFVLVTSSLGGYVFAKIRFPGREAIFILVLSLLMVPFNVTLIPLYRLIVELGWHNTHWALIVPATVNPLGIFLMRQFMHGIPEEIIEAARVDGAREFTIWWRIVVPLTTPAVAALGIFIFLWTWDDFLWPLVALSDVELYTLPLGLSQLRGRFGADVGAAMAGATVAVMPVLVAFLFAQRRFVEGVTMTGIK